jgi:hypothetical protein
MIQLSVRDWSKLMGGGGWEGAGVHPKMKIMKNNQKVIKK